MNEVWTAERIALAQVSCNKWHGVKHCNRMAIPGVGIDCVQLIREILADAGVIEACSFGDYDVIDGMHNVSQRLSNAVQFALDVESVGLDTVQFGDIAIFRTGKRSGHIGFCTGKNIYHALANLCVTRSQFSLWRHEIEFLYRIKSVGLKNNPQQAAKL